MKLLKVAAIAAFAIGGIIFPASAATNLALSADGASFVDASSFTQYATGNFCCGGPINGGLSTMQNDVITDTPIAWLANTDTRYIFATGDQDQWIEIDLGTLRSLESFGVTFNSIDRAVVGPFYVETSLNGTTWTQQGPAINNPSSGTSLINLGSPVGAEYVKYFFGPTTSQYGGDGSAVSQVFANAVPEPAIWAMMLLGFFGVGGMMRRTNAIAHQNGLPAQLDCVLTPSAYQNLV